jgi:anti-sigma factor RsiW
MQDRNVAGITCSAVLAVLSDYLDGEVSDAVRAQVNAHLAGCDVCERFGGRFATTVGALRRHLAEPKVSDERLSELAALLDDAP